MTRIMVVEDEPLVAADVEDCVQSLGYELAATACSGEEAVARASTEPLDLVLMDIRLGRGHMDGVEAASQLAQRFHVPVVFLTAFADKQTIQRACEAEPFGYVLKPFTEREVAQAIDAALSRQRSRKKRDERDVWLEGTFRSLSEGVLLIDERGRVVMMNAFAEALAGMHADDAAGKPWRDVLKVVGPTEESMRTSMERALGGDAAVSAPMRATLRLRGQDIPIELSAVPVTREQSAGSGVALVVRDVRELQRSTVPLSMGERLSALSTFASGLAHEINNPLTAVATGIDLAHRDAASLEAQLGPAASQHLATLAGRIRSSLRAAQTGVDRVEGVVKDLSVFSRPGRERRPLALSLALESALRLVENQIRHRARLVKDFGGAPLVDANEPQLVRALVALLVNAAEAIPEGQAERHLVRVSLRTAEDGASVVEVQDTGRGITPDIMVRMYDPFFTTKPVGSGGMGLGLSIAHSIVAGHGGEISARSEPGRGSTFTVRLPPSRTVASVATASAPRVEPRRLRLLIVDDERAIGTLLAMSFGASHDVTVTTSAREALDKLAQERSFDVVLCDISMPEMDGIALYERVSLEHPSVAPRFVFMTGGAFTARTERFLGAMVGRYVLKPPHLDVLERMLLAVAGADVDRPTAELRT